MEPASGRQFELRRGRQRAVVVEVGGGLREYEVDGQAVLDGYPLDRMCDGGRGQPLLPWPNRLEDGRYEFGGRTLQLPVDEAEKRNAIHGLTRWLNWNLVEQAVDRVRLQLAVHPRPGYPFLLQLQVAYELKDDGLSVTTSARNLGAEALPFGAGQHPYFTVGTPFVNEANLRLPANSRLELDRERSLPTGQKLTVDGTAFDFRVGRTIGDTVIDDCFTDLTRDSDDRARVTLQHGRAVTVWVDEHYKYLQVFSGETLAPDRRRRGLAIEPMTCPPNAFRSGVDVITLQPGEAIELKWGLTNV